jgi:tRNA A-37 threonylcarbamoyl transferase component Bud32
MSDDTNKDEVLSADDLALVLHGLASSPARRITSLDILGRRVWIKRYDIEPLALAKRLHWLVSPILFPVFLRGSAPALGEAGVERECSKMAAFRAAGFQTPDVVYRSGATLVLSDVSPVLTNQLFGASQEERRARLLKLFSALGRMHSAGLVHGRPHLRDMSIRNDEVCFFDFEEAPETAMPLADAQARDLWLLMLPLVDWMPDEKIRMMCLKTWLAKAPSPAVLALIRFLGFCRPVVAAAGLLPARLGGNDLKRFLATARFLVASLSDMENALAASGPRTAAKRIDS